MRPADWSARAVCTSGTASAVSPLMEEEKTAQLVFAQSFFRRRYLRCSRASCIWSCVPPQRRPGGRRFGRLVLSEFGILVQSLLLSCRVSRSTGCAETTAEGSPEGAELDAEREFTSGPTAEGSADAAGRRFLLTFFRCRKKVSLGSGVKLPTLLVAGAGGRPSRLRICEGRFTSLLSARTQQGSAHRQRRESPQIVICSSLCNKGTVIDLRLSESLLHGIIKGWQYDQPLHQRSNLISLCVPSRIIAAFSRRPNARRRHFPAAVRFIAGCAGYAAGSDHGGKYP